MDEKTLLDAVSQHIGLLSGLQWWMLVTAMATIYMVVNRKDELDLKFFKVTKEDAAVLVGALYVIVTAGIFVALIRLHGLLGMLPESQLPAAVTEIVTHSWLFNPFAYFGSAGLYKFTALASLAAFIVAWCLGFVALSLLGGKYPRAHVILLIFHFALSLVTLAALQQVYFLMVEKTAQAAPELSATLASMSQTRLSWLKWVGGLGLLAALAAVWRIERMEKEARARAIKFEQMLD